MKSTKKDVAEVRRPKRERRQTPPLITPQRGTQAENNELQNAIKNNNNKKGNGVATLSVYTHTSLHLTPSSHTLKPPEATRCACAR